MDPTNSTVLPHFDLSVNHGPIIGVVTWVLLITSVLAMIIRLASKYAFAKKLYVDDFLALIALGFNIAAVVAVSIQTNNGLGQSIQRIDQKQLENFSKSEYAAGFFFIATLVFAKLSIVMLLRQLSPDETHTMMGMVLGISITLWGVSSILAQAFQCHTPQPWDSINAVCFDRAIFWRVFGAMNILTDVVFTLTTIFEERISFAKPLIRSKYD